MLLRVTGCGFEIQQMLDTGYWMQDPKKPLQVASCELQVQPTRNSHHKSQTDSEIEQMLDAGSLFKEPVRVAGCELQVK